MILQLAQCILVLVGVLIPVAIVIIRQQGKEEYNGRKLIS